MNRPSPQTALRFGCSGCAVTHLDLGQTPNRPSSRPRECSSELDRGRFEQRVSRCGSTFGGIPRDGLVEVGRARPGRFRRPRALVASAGFGRRGHLGGHGARSKEHASKGDRNPWKDMVREPAATSLAHQRTRRWSKALKQAPRGEQGAARWSATAPSAALSTLRRAAAFSGSRRCSVQVIDRDGASAPSLVRIALAVCAVASTSVGASRATVEAGLGLLERWRSDCAVGSMHCRVSPPPGGVPGAGYATRHAWHLPVGCMLRINCKKATAAVTRNGCRRGDTSKGPSMVGTPSRHPGAPRRAAVALTAKHHEPQVRMRDATSPHARSGANRRGGAKPRGRNTTVRLVGAPPKCIFGCAGVDATSRTRRRGGRWMNPKRGGIARAVPARVAVSEGEAKTMKVGS